MNTHRVRLLTGILVFAVTLIIPATGAVAEPQRLTSTKPPPLSAEDRRALELGRRVLALQQAIRNPATPGALAAVQEIGLDSRHYTMVRGWLSLQLQGDLSIAAANAPPARIAERIEFLRRAIRAIDLE